MATAKRILALGIALCLMIGTACAEFDVTQYSYEELLQIQEAVKTRMEELDRQYALEHADRRISFETEETVLYLGETIRMLQEEAAGGSTAGLYYYIEGGFR